MKKLKVLLLILLGAMFIGALAACGGGKKYSVTFETYGGTYIRPYSLSAGAKIKRPADPEKDLYTFGGWYTDETFGTEFDFKQKMPKNDVTVYANWRGERSTRVTFDSMGGTPVTPSVGTVGSPLAAPQEPTYTGYQFGGWYSDPECTKFFAFTAFPDRDVTLYARWVDDANYAYIRYFGNGRQIARVPVEKGQTVEEPSFFDADICVDGWYTDAEHLQKYEFGTNAAQNVDLYASYYTQGLKFEGGSVVSYSGTSENVSVPDRVNSTAVTSVGDSAFAEQQEIRTVSLPAGITSVGKSAFYGCSRLVSVDLTQKVTSIGSYAFFNCIRLTSYGDITGVEAIPEGLFLGCRKLPAVTLSATAKSVGKQAFSDCAVLKEIVLPDPISSLPDGLFDGCTALEKVTLPKSLASIGEDVFAGCGSLSAISVDKSNAAFTLNDGNLYRKKADEGLELIRYAPGTKGEKEFRLPELAVHVVAGAFDGVSSLESIVVGNKATELDCGAFAGIRSLATLTLPTLGEKGFLGYFFGATEAQSAGNYSLSIPETLRSVTVTEPISEVAAYAFFGAVNLEEVAGLGKIQKIGQYAFANTSIREFNIPASLTTIESFAFQGCTSLSRFTVEEGNKNFAEFDGCLYNNDKSQLRLVPATREHIEFASEATQIANSAFADSSVKELVVPETITSIDYAAFRTCNSIESLTVPFIGKGSDQEDDRYMGYIFGSIITLKPQVDADKNHYNGAELSNASNIPTSLHTVTITKPCTEIPNRAFAYMRGLKQVNFTEDSTITSIGDLAFYCDPIESWDFGGVTKIGDYAFRETSLKEVSLPATLTSFGYAAFSMIEPLEKITLAEGITKVAPQAFVASGTSNSSAVHGVEFHSAYNSELVIPSTVTEIGSDAFNGIGMMFDGSRRNVPNSAFSVRFAADKSGKTALTKIGNGAFAYAAIRTLEIPASVQEIGLQAFVYCDSLTDVTIGSAKENSKLTTFGAICFSGCSQLSAFTLYTDKVVTMTLYQLTSTTQCDIFYSASTRFSVYVPKNMVENYKTADNWKTYENRIRAIEAEQGGAD